MQIFVVLLIMPWLILLSQAHVYQYIRIMGAALAGIAAIAWIAERSLGNSNTISSAVVCLSRYATWFIATLAFSSLIVFFLKKAPVPASTAKRNAKL